jgi:hypothetical protein
MLQSQLLGYISIAGPNEKNGRIESWLQNEASSLTSFDLALDLHRTRQKFIS